MTDRISSNNTESAPLSHDPLHLTMSSRKQQKRTYFGRGGLILSFAASYYIDVRMAGVIGNDFVTISYCLDQEGSTWRVYKR